MTAAMLLTLWATPHAQGVVVAVLAVTAKTGHLVSPGTAVRASRWHGHSRRWAYAAEAAERRPPQATARPRMEGLRALSESLASTPRMVAGRADLQQGPAKVATASS